VKGGQKGGCDQDMARLSTDARLQIAVLHEAAMILLAAHRFGGPGGSQVQYQRGPRLAVLGREPAPVPSLLGFSGLLPGPCQNNQANAVTGIY
jgi:hypothetical protein